MSQHLLTFELSPDGDELFLHGDEAGLRYLSAQLLRLAEHAACGEFEHTHLMTDAWGGDGLSDAPQSETGICSITSRSTAGPNKLRNDRNAEHALQRTRRERRVAELGALPALRAPR